MADKDLSKVELTEDMSDYLYAKYEKNWKVKDRVSYEILDDLWNNAMVKG